MLLGLKNKLKPFNIINNFDGVGVTQYNETYNIRAAIDETTNFNRQHARA